MKFNMVGDITNSTGSAVSLTSTELESLVDGITSSGIITVPDASTMIISCDLINRYDINNVKYYYDSGSVLLDVAESSGFWISVVGSDFSGGKQFSFDDDYNPRWVRVTHEASGSDASSHELEVYNEDENILFGHSGIFDSYGVDASGAEIDTISIYNPTSSVRDIKVFIGAGNYSEQELALSYGLTSSGTFYSQRENGIIFPDTFSWDFGSHTNTMVSGTSLTLSGVSVSGTYYSPVIDLSSTDGGRFFWDAAIGEDDLVTYGTYSHSEAVFGVRRNNVPPSGVWVSGQLAEDEDALWSVDTGSLGFSVIDNNSILELRNNYYLQFCVTITGSYSNPPLVYKAGVEFPLIVEDIQPNSYKDIFVATASGAQVSGSSNLTCFYEE